MKAIDWSQVPEASEYARLSPGGYICRIDTATDFPDREYIKIEYDIAEGPQAGYYRNLFQNKGFWGGSLYRSYKEKALPMFKTFLKAVEESNPGYVFRNDENTLRGKLLGLVLSEEEYRKNDGTTGKRLYISEVKSVQKIRQGNFQIRQLRKLAQSPSEGYYPADEAEEDLPF